MQFFNTKKPAADTAALDAAEEHKQSIGDQVMEALGVGDGAEEQMHGGKIKGNIEADTKAVVIGAIEGNITCKEDVFGEHAAVIGEYIRCGVLTVEPGARIAAKIEMTKPGDKEEREAEKPLVHYDVPGTDAVKPGDKNYPKIEKHMDKPKNDDNKAKH